MNGKIAILLDEALSKVVRENTLWEVSRIEHIDGKDIAILKEVKLSSDPMRQSIANMIEDSNAEPR